MSQIEEEETWTTTEDGFPKYRMWKLDYIMVGDFSYSFKKYKRWLFRQRVKKILRRIKNVIK